MTRFGFLITLVLCTLCLSAARAGEVLSGPVKAQVTRVLDGDTLVVRVQIWLGQVIETRVRLSGIDTPELRGRCDDERRRAQEARQALAALIQSGTVVLKDIRQAKYAGRVLATAHTSSGINIAAHMIGKGLARPYHGGQRRGWCSTTAM